MRLRTAVFAVVCLAWLCVPASAAERPNIIFILSDDLAQGDVGCYGQKLIQTPNLDRMSREGTRFTQAYCGTTVCAPSRTSQMTGLHSGHSPVRANWEIARGEGQLPLPDGTVTVASILKDADYATTDWTPQQKAYAAQVSRLDADAGRILALLKELKVDEQTLVMLAGDNGPPFDEKSEVGRRFGQSMGGKLRGFKRSMYEGRTSFAHPTFCCCTATA